MRKQNKKLMTIMIIFMLCFSQQPLQANAAGLQKTTATVSKRAKKTATLKIKKVKKATGYQIFIANSKKGKYKQTGATRTRSFQVLNLKASKSYYVKVRAYRTSGNRILTGSFSKSIKIDKYVKTTDADKYAAEVLSIVNQERSKQSLSELKRSTKLNTAACERAKELVEKFSHTRPDGRDCFTILTDMEIVYSSVGENIASGQKTPKQVMKSWMESEGHQANILSSTYTTLGVGYYKDSDSGICYWVQIFTKE